MEAWLARNIDDSLYLFLNEPILLPRIKQFISVTSDDTGHIRLPSDSPIGKTVTYKSSPTQIFIIFFPKEELENPNEQ